MREYEISIRVIDFLANEEVLTDRIVMRNKKVGNKTVLTTDNKLLRL